MNMDELMMNIDNDWLCCS